MNLYELVNLHSFEEIKESFLDLYPDEEDDIDKFEHVYNILQTDDEPKHLRLNLNDFTLGMEKNNDNTPYFTIETKEGNKFHLDVFHDEWGFIKFLTLSDNMFIEYSTERLSAILLSNLGEQMVFDIFDDDL